MTVFALAAVLAVFSCALYQRVAYWRGWVAWPNARSSHQAPTASGAGVAVFFALALVVAMPLARMGATQYQGVLLLALLLVPLGFADDLRPLPVRLRLLVYAVLAALASWQLHPGEQAAAALPLQLGLLLGAVWILGFTNLYNFMDGIDGLAAVQCASAAVVAAVIAQAVGASAAYQLLCLALAGAHVGFLLFNWPPARLFLGDAGSVPGGFLLAALALAGHWLEAFPLVVWPVLLAVFVSDASFTLCQRWWRGERLGEAHRQHLYQRAARHFGSHRPVTLGFVCLQWWWLTPLALCCVRWPQWQWVCLLSAYLPLLVVMAKFRRMQ